MHALKSTPFSMGSILDALLFEDEKLPDKSRRECRMQELLCIPDSEHNTHTKIDTWKALLDCTLNKKHPDVYIEDVMRSCWKVNGAIFSVDPDADDKPMRMQRIDNEILSTLIRLQCPLAEATADLHLLRYLVQDIMNQMIFVLDPHFVAHYNDTLLQRGMMLLNSDHDVVFSLRSKGTSLYLTALQYWKVIDPKSPATIKGYDAQQVDIVINLENASKATLLDCIGLASCTMQFHGVREKVDELTY